MKKINKPEFIAGVAILVVLLLGGGAFLQDGALYYRMLVGLGLGYTLTRALFGFAGSANRTYNGGSTKLLRTLCLMFFLSAVIVAALCYIGGAENYGLWINQINLGLVVGGLMFGIGMAFSMCCASGVLTDIVAGPPRALITLLFFGVGVFVGFPVQKAGWVANTMVHSSSFESGVFLPDLFTFDGMNGYLGALILTGILCLLVAGIAKGYENYRRKNGTYTGIDSERLQEKAEIEMLQDETDTPVISESTVYRVFAKPWTLKTGAFVITILFSTLMIVTKGGWGASTPYGYWFGRILHLFGMSTETIVNYTQQSEGPFTMPFFTNAMNVQNVSIILGALVATLMMGMFTSQLKETLKITPKEALSYVVGGLLMGFGTRLSNGCNVGALYTPIANLSLSGWLYFIFLFSGGIIGNILKRYYFSCKINK